MATIVTRQGKGSKLTIPEMDNNFTNLNQQGINNAAILPNKADLVAGTVVPEQLPPTPLSAVQFEQLSNLTHQIKGSWLTNFILQVLANQEGNIIPVGPTLFIVDNIANTADWTADPDYPNLSDYEYTLDGGDTIVSTPDLTKPLIIGNLNYPPGKVGIRVKAASGRTASPWLFNGTAYTVDAEPSEFLLSGMTFLDITNGLVSNITETEDNIYTSAIDSNGGVTTKYLMPYLSEIAIPYILPEVGENIQCIMGLLGGYELSGNVKGIKMHNGVLYQYDGNNGEEIVSSEFQPETGDFVIGRYVYDPGDPSNYNNRELLIFLTKDAITYVPVTLPLGRIAYVNSPNGWIAFGIDAPSSLLKYPQGKGVQIDPGV